MKQQPKIIDGDGHVFEDSEGIARHFPYTAAGGRLRNGVFPTQSHIQFSLTLHHATSPVRQALSLFRLV